jgi:hypothetical protein
MALVLRQNTLSLLRVVVHSEDEPGAEFQNKRSDCVLATALDHHEGLETHDLTMYP